MSDTDEEEITFRYGTPLQPIDEEDGPPRKKLLQDNSDQYAVDSHGKRRFHGAFTGGFSAGYGNSVGTPEGFTPATFKSSRFEKATLSGQRPEDYMDEEDRSEFGIAPRILQKQGDFSGLKRTNQMRFHDGTIPGEPVLENLLRPVHETAAVKILKSMGWRPGQGTGERLTRVEKRNSKRNRKVYGCQLPSEVSDNFDKETYLRGLGLFPKSAYCVYECETISKKTRLVINPDSNEDGNQRVITKNFVKKSVSVLLNDKRCTKFNETVITKKTVTNVSSKKKNAEDDFPGVNSDSDISEISVDFNDCQSASEASNIIQAIDSILDSYKLKKANRSNEQTVFAQDQTNQSNSLDSTKAKNLSNDEILSSNVNELPVVEEAVPNFSNLNSKTVNSITMGNNLNKNSNENKEIMTIADTNSCDGNIASVLSPLKNDSTISGLHVEDVNMNLIGKNDTMIKKSTNSEYNVGVPGA